MTKKEEEEIGQYVLEDWQKNLRKTLFYSNPLADRISIWKKVGDLEPDRDFDIEDIIISKRCVVKYDDEDRVARYNFETQQWVCCVRGIVLHGIKWFMQIPELEED